MVGPRPEMLANVFNYTSVLPEFEYRLRVKAGITGHAQIAGKYNTSPRLSIIQVLPMIMLGMKDGGRKATRRVISMATFSVTMLPSRFFM